MSILRLVKVALGFSTTATNNFVLRAMDDGNLRISRGNADTEIRDVLTIHADDALSARFSPGFTGLKASASGTSASVEISADSLAVMSAAGMTRLLRNVALSISSAGVGANGLDAGALAASTWYALFVICKDDGSTAGLLSLSATAPTLPAGYTHFARVGWIRTDGTTNKYPLGFTQYGRRVQYKQSAGILMAQGVAGNPSATPPNGKPVWSSIDLADFTPYTASNINGYIIQAGASAQAMAAPNNSYGEFTSTLNPPPVSSISTSYGIGGAAQFNFIIESTNIYWASSNSAGAILCSGWEDNL